MSIRFNLKFNGTDLHKLSPGEKGVLLLAFFLLAEKDTSPIIIDQPEDNLDKIILCLKFWLIVLRLLKIEDRLL
jgi:hypothetical protein